MADVSRGQLLVVAALMLAVLFVGLALVLNSGIYAENLASRETGGDGDEALETQHTLKSTFPDTIDRVNAKVITNDYGNLRDRLERANENHTNALVGENAKRGVVIDVAHEDPQRGIRLRQTEETRNFSDKNGKANWNLTTTVPESGQVTMSIKNGSLYKASYDTTMAVLADSAFGLVFYLEDAAGAEDGIWRIYLFQGGSTSNVYAVVEKPDQNFTNLENNTLIGHVVDGWLNQSCSTQGAVVTMRVEDGKFGGAPCSEFGFYEDIGEHTLAMTNAYTEDGAGNEVDRANGTYDILLRGENRNSGVFHTAIDGQPFWQSAVYSQNVSITYRTDASNYNVENYTVVPKEYHPGGILWEFPRIDRFHVTMTDNDPPTFDVDWNVSHPEGDLDEVQVLLVDRTATTDVCLDLDVLCDVTKTYNANETVDEETVSVSGPSAGGVTTITHSDGYESINSYTIRFVVRDDLHRTRVANEDWEVDT